MASWNIQSAYENITLLCSSAILCISFCPGSELQQPGEMLYSASTNQEGNLPLIFPVPSDIKVSEGNFSIDSNTTILIPQKPSGQDRFLAGLIAAEFADKYELPVMLSSKTSLPGTESFILIGDITNPLVKSYCDQKSLSGELKDLERKVIYFLLHQPVSSSLQIIRREPFSDSDHSGNWFRVMN